MGPPPATGYAWSSGPAKQDVDVDTIDLTTSSPEPEQRARAPPQQQRLPAYFKQEARADFGGSSRIKTEQRAPEMKSRGSRQRARQIHPQHMARLIDTSNPQALRAVLLTLCKTSPALSGAVARGLAPYSTFAQGLIKQHHQQNQQGSTSRAVKPEENAQDTYTRMKQRLTAPRSTSASSLNRVQSPANISSTIGAAHNPRYAGSQSVPRIKREPPPDMGDTDSDNDSFIPGAFPHSSQQATPNRLPLRSTPGPSTAFRSPRLNSFHERLARAQGTPSVKIKAERQSCTLCHKPIEDETDTCFYHPDSEVNAEGDLRCTDCKEPLWEMGCMLGMHVSESDAQLKRSQPIGSQSPSKRPRII
jgi:hypothetical protein